MRKHLIIPDVQAKPGVPFDHLNWIGKYILEQKPDVLINIGDFADMPSLSSYDKGKKRFEGRSIDADLKAAHIAMNTLMGPIHRHNKNKAKWKKAQYKPEMHLTLGNHEERILRYVDENREVEGVIGIKTLEYEKHGWIVHDFLKPVCVDGITYCHYFYNQNSGRPYSGTCENRLKNIGFSFTQGHEQGLRMAIMPLNNGGTYRGIVAGSCYLHYEDYKGPQGNNHWQGIIVKHEVENGDYCVMEVSLDYLCRKYEQMTLARFMREKYPELLK